MAFQVDSISVASGANNEDRFGHSGDGLAWVIDGATDVLDEPLIGDGTDAAWFAEAAHRALTTAKLPGLDRFCDLPAQICNEVATEFWKEARRKPAGRHEHPSAAAIVVHVHDGRVTYVAVGDCALIGRSGQALHVVGLGGKEGGDRSTAQVLASFHAQNSAATPEDAKAHMWPKILSQRAKINMPDGYGALSLTAPPPQFVVTGSFDVAPGDRLLLASDGLTRLTEVYGRYDPSQLLDAAVKRGLSDLVAELRQIEAADAACRIYPRVKTSDDATGMLLTIL